MKKKIQSIADIAKIAGVSKSTVSRALNDSPLLKKETREKIKKIAKQYNFEAHYGAKILSLQQTNTIGFIFPTSKKGTCQNYNFSNQFFLQIVAAIVSALSEFKYDLLFGQTEGDLPKEIQHYLNTKRVDGLILFSCHRDLDRLLNIFGKKIPLIVLGTTNTEKQFCSVSSDNIMGGFLATEHLIKNGRKKIAFIGGFKGTADTEMRFEGYKKALKQYQLPLVDSNIIYSDYSGSGGFRSMFHLLEKNPDIDAVFVNNDVMAVGAIEAIHKKGKRIPEDIAIVGFDDISLACYNNPPLTTVRQNLPEIGKLLVKNLMQFLEDGKITNQVLPVELIVRKSSGSLINN